jgi:hypothetical protein
MLANGTVTAHLVRYSIMIRIYLLPLCQDGRIAKSAAHIFPGDEGVMEVRYPVF